MPQIVAREKREAGGGTSKDTGTFTTKLASVFTYYYVLLVRRSLSV